MQRGYGPEAAALFLKCCKAVAAEYPEITYAEHIVDNACMQLVLNPYQYDVILTENLYGDILSDLCSAFVGGLGLVPGANLGTTGAIFEAVHGSAPDIAGQDKANPTALLQSAILMLHPHGAQRGHQIPSSVPQYHDNGAAFDTITLALIGLSFFVLLLGICLNAMVQAAEKRSNQLTSDKCATESGSVYLQCAQAQLTSSQMFFRWADSEYKAPPK